MSKSLSLFFVSANLLVGEEFIIFALVDAFADLDLREFLTFWAHHFAFHSGEAGTAILVPLVILRALLFTLVDVTTFLGANDSK